MLAFPVHAMKQPRRQLTLLRPVAVLLLQQIVLLPLLGSICCSSLVGGLRVQRRLLEHEASTQSFGDRRRLVQARKMESEEGGAAGGGWASMSSWLGRGNGQRVLESDVGGLEMVPPSSAAAATAQTAAAIALGEMNALLQFKSLVLDPANALVTWQPVNQSLLATKGPCNWAGVTCAKGKLQRVTKVELVRKQLRGKTGVSSTLPDTFCTALPSLAHLDLSYNMNEVALGGLTGTLPTSLGLCTRLTLLNLQSNQFTGPIPSTLSALTAIQTLNLAGNMLSGAFPPALPPSLVSIDLSQNILSGPIPSSISSLSLLSSLKATGNKVSGKIPDALSKLAPSLKDILLTENELSGTIPSSLSALTGLSSLRLAKNQLEGTLPTQLSTLTGVALLELNENRLTGPFPDILMKSWGSVPLGSINLKSNNLSGPIPPSVSTAAGIGSLILDNNSFSGTLPKDMFLSAMYIMSVGLSSNGFSGPIPTSFTGGILLSALTLNDNQFSGPIPTNLATSLGDISLGNNRLTGKIPDMIGTLTGLFSLNVSGNSLSGSIPKSLSGLTGLSVLDVSRNPGLSGPLPIIKNCPLVILRASSTNLSGPIPPRFRTCAKLAVADMSDSSFSDPFPPLPIGKALASLNLSGNAFSGPIPTSVAVSPGLTLLSLAHNQFNGTINATALRQLPRLLSFELQNNLLSGSIPGALGNMTILTQLSLDGNNFSGDIPSELAPPFLPRIRSLTLSSNKLSGGIPFGFANISLSVSLNFSFNNLSGAIPPGNLSQFPSWVFEGNSGLCGGPGYPPCPEPPSSSSLSTGAIVGIAVGGAALVLIALFLAWWALRKRNGMGGGKFLVFEKMQNRLTLDHIIRATDNFSDKYMLGRGGFGAVYKAPLEGGRLVAIKRLSLGSSQGDKEFIAEMQTLGNFRHRNLVTLVAAYIAPEPSPERLLIYDFLPGGSLDHVLAKDLAKDSPLREWPVRRSIALDTARGMKYLHHDCNPRIVHRDMKPANVLLDDKCNSYVADFGLAREMDAGKSHKTTAVFGTIGYLAPEYTQRGHLSFKSDVFAYGVLLLQLITGKQPTDEEVSERGLSRWVGAHSVHKVCDDRMSIDGYVKQILGAIQLGILCTSRCAADRPTMAEVVHVLENLEDFAEGIANPEDEEDGEGDEEEGEE